MALAVLIVVAASQTPKLPRTSEAWSRGLIVGQTPVKRVVALRPVPDGGVYLIWQGLEGRLELAHIDEGGEVVQNRVLGVGEGRASDPQLQVGSEGRLHLMWREGEHPNSSVRYAMLDSEGSLVDQPRVVSDPEVPVVGGPRLVGGVDNGYHAIWADDAGIRWATLGADGTVARPPAVLFPEGRFPAVREDGDGRLHLVYHHSKQSNVEAIYYLTFDPESGALGEPVEIVERVLRAGQRLVDPAIGLTHELCYVFWIVQDFKTVDSDGEYAAFPLGHPEQRRVEPLGLRQGRSPVAPYAPEGVRASGLVGFSESVPDAEVMGVIRSQVAVLALGAGESREQIVTGSAQASLDPTLAVDERAYLHLAWLESAEFGRYQVAYASTGPDVMRNYNRLTAWDVVDTVFSKVFRLATVVVTLVSVLILWAILPLLGLIVYHLVTSAETLDTVRSWAALAVALVASSNGSRRASASRWTGRPCVGSRRSWRW